MQRCVPSIVPVWPVHTLVPRPQALPEKEELRHNNVQIKIQILVNVVRYLHQRRNNIGISAANSPFTFFSLPLLYLYLAFTLPLRCLYFAFTLP